MKKKKKRERKLNLDDLEIESFETTVASEVGGAGSCTCGCLTCDWSCPDLTCNGGPC